MTKYGGLKAKSYFILKIHLDLIFLFGKINDLVIVREKYLCQFLHLTFILFKFVYGPFLITFNPMIFEK